ncbi:anti-sigma factor [Streptomyces zagrosensis]|uniref:Regulator of SigK n=1 Tax=Streptomyces zagrosensis TaxID=1042984 RepID=A0A7W9Q9V5_9ACTN|nr:anti-sigma factor [Streptomyces zagrosensis]MBB5935152.1 anti-sigma-K factor RskA [Streptomyces zagrosensis]
MTAELHTLTGAYALHALPGPERERFERHLAACEACAQEVREFTETTTRLGLAASILPRPELRDRVLRRISSVRQTPPQDLRRGVSNGRGLGWITRRTTQLALAACVSAAAALGGVALWQHQEAEQARSTADRAQQRAEALTRVIAAPDAKTTNGRLADGGVATVIASRSQNKVAVLAAGAPELPAGKVYQMWFNDGGTMRPAGLLGRGGSSAAALMSGAIEDASGMGITVEPAGGSPHPTTSPVAALQLPA